MKYKLTVVLFIAVICLSVSVVLINFNRIVAPTVPVSAFRLESVESGYYHLEFLGESLVVKWPVVNNPIGYILEQVASFCDMLSESLLPDILRLFNSLKKT